MSPAAAPNGSQAAISQQTLKEVRTKEAALGTSTVPHSVSSTTVIVTSTVDSPLATDATTCEDQETTPSCSLRAAVQLANNLGTPVTIDLPPDVFKLTDTTLGSLVVDNPGGTTILGSGTSQTTIEVPSGDDYGVIQLTSSAAGGSTLWLSDLTLSGGEATDGGGLQMVEPDDSAVLNSVEVSHNSASSYGGGIACGTAGYGGSLWLNNSTVSGNTADDGGGIYSDWCNMHFDKLSLESNSVSEEGGGLWEEDGNVTFTGGQVAQNTAEEGGGIYNEYGLNQLNDLTIENNAATDGSGGGDYEYWSQAAITGGSITGNTAEGSDNGGGGLAILYGANVTLDDVAVTSNTTSSHSYEYSGGGIYAYEGDERDEPGLQLTIEDGSSVSGNTGGGIGSYGYYGGGEIDISDSTVSNNTSTIDSCGAAICNVVEYGGLDYSLANDTIESNSETGGDTEGYPAGAVVMWAYYGAADMEMSDTTVADNTSSSEEGTGGIVMYAEYYADATAKISGSTIDDNSATGEYATGGILADSEEYSNSTLNISDSTLSGNTAPYGGEGGAVCGYDEAEYSPVELNLNNDEITDNSVGSNIADHEGEGGGIYLDDYATLNLTNSTVSDNTAVGNSSDGGSGAGIFDQSYQVARLVSDTITGNSATANESEGGGMYSYDDYGGDLISNTTIADNSAEYGAGYYGDETADLALVDSTVSDNTAGGVNALPGYGGGLALDDVALDSINSTIADNRANPGGVAGYGGGIYAYEDAAATLSYTTISGNVAADGAGYYGYGSTEASSSGALSSSIISGNTTTSGGSTAADCAYYGTGQDLNSIGGNVIGQTGCVTSVMPSDVVSSSPGLAALALNGGTTKTMALESTSPAVGLSSGPCPATDQRGQARPGINCDSGAYQRGTANISAISPATGLVGTKVTIHGSNFDFATKVTFGSKSASFVVDSPTEITATVPAGPTGAVAVAVYTYDGSGTTKTFTYPSPGVISAISPPKGTAGTKVTIHGSGFSYATKVTFGSKSASFTKTSNTLITATAPSGLTGAVTVTVTTPAGHGKTATFTYNSASKKKKAKKTRR